MKRREMLKTASLAAISVSAFPFGWAAAEEEKKQKVLYFTRSAGFEHSVVHREGDQLSHSEKVLTEILGVSPEEIPQLRADGVI